MDGRNDVIWTEHAGIQTSHFSNWILSRGFFFLVVFLLFISLRAIRSLHVCIFSFFHYQVNLTRLHSFSEAHPVGSSYLAFRLTSYII